MAKPLPETKEVLVSDEVLSSKIYVFRNQKVMFDRDLADLYGVTTGNLNKAVKRNIKRFPEDFLFQLNKEDFKNLLFQNGIASWGGTRTPPYAFTEQGVAMLSGIMRIFTKLRQLLSDNTKTHQELTEIKLTLEKVARKQDGHDKNIELLFEYIDRLQEKDVSTPQERKAIGYKIKGK